MGPLRSHHCHPHGYGRNSKYFHPHSVSLYMYTMPDYSYALSINSQYGMVIILTSFSATCLLAGCIGLCGVFQLKSGILTTFWIVMTVCIFGFGAGAAIGLATPLLFQSYGCTGQVYPAVYTMNNQTSNAILTFCKLNCTCFLNTTGGFNTTGVTGLTNSTNVTLPISVIQCVNWPVGIYDRLMGTF